jgi:hypothetical protein
MSIRFRLICAAFLLALAPSSGNLSAQDTDKPGIASIPQETNSQFSQNIKLPGPSYSNQDLGLLVIFIDPGSAEIHLDGELIGPGPLYDETIPGKHMLKITNKGWLEEKVELEIQENRKTVVTALLRKPPPTLLTPEDLGKTRMEEFSFEDIEKDEYEIVLIRPEWPQKYKKSSVLLMGISTIMALATVEPTQFVPGETKLVGQIALTGVTLGFIGVAVFHVADETTWTWEERPLYQNIEFNKRKKAEIREHNQRARHYNQVILPQMQNQITTMRKEIEEFNKERGIRIEIY